MKGPQMVGDEEDEIELIRRPGDGPPLFAVLVSYVAGALRLARFRGVTVASMGLTMAVRAGVCTVQPEEAALPLRMKRSAFKSYDEIVNELSLVYQCSLFDAFLTDVTTILALANPGKWLPDTYVPLGQLVESTNIDIINRRVRKKVKQIALGTFLERIDTICQRCSLPITITYEQKSALRQWAEVRNAVIHSQSVFAIELIEKGKIRAVERTKVAVSADDVRTANRVFDPLVVQIYEPVSKFLSGAEMRPPERRLCEAIILALDGQQPSYGTNEEGDATESPPS